MTGDRFRMDDHGFLYFLGRQDDMIKTRGEKVYPREIEDVLLSASGVLEAAVVGVSDPLLGQAIHAHLAPAPGMELDVYELRRLCEDRLEAHLIPTEIVLHPYLPKTGNGKVDRQALEEGRAQTSASAGARSSP